MKIEFKRQVLPHVIAVFIFLLITIGFFNPVFFENKEIIQHDIQQWTGSAKELMDYRDKTGEEGLWTNSMFSGMPGYLISVEWSNKPIEYLHRIYTFWLPHPVLTIFASFLSFYLLLLAFEIKPEWAIGLAVAYGLSSFMIIGLSAGHNARIGSIAYVPLILAGIHLTIARPRYRWLGLGITTMAMALHLRLNHLQITYYTLLVVFIYGAIMLYHTWKNGTLRIYLVNVGLLAGAVLIAVGSMIGELWATYEYGQYSMRGKSELSSDIAAGENEDGLKRDYAFQYSNSIFEPLFLFIPDFMGGSSSNIMALDPDSKTRQALIRSNDQQLANQLAQFSRSYWGKQGLTAPYYGGAIIGFYFILGILFVDKKIKIWLLATFALGIMLSWGSNFSSFNYFMFDYFPGYNKFRAVTFAIILPIFAMGLLGGLGLQKFFQSDYNKTTQKKFLLSFGIFSGLCLFLIIIAGMINMSAPVDAQLPAWYAKALQSDRAALLREDAFRSLILVAIAFGIMWFIRKGKIKSSLGAAALILLVTFDMWSVSSRYFTSDNFERNMNRSFFLETEADKFIKQDDDLSYRVYNIRNWTEARTSYYHKSLGGYHGAKMRRYQDLFDNVLQPQTQKLIDVLQSGGNFSSLGGFNMLNTKYFSAGIEREMVFRNPSALGNAWLVEDAQMVNNPDEELQALGKLDPGKTAVIDGSKFKPSSMSFNSHGSIRLTSYNPNHMVYSYSGEGPSLAVFSEIYYPKGWVATLDGEEANILRVNYVLRALELPAGNHNIEFRYEPTAYLVGNKITAVFNIVVLLVFISSVYVTLRQRNPVSE